MQMSREWLSTPQTLVICPWTSYDCMCMRERGGARTEHDLNTLYAHMEFSED